MTFVNGNIYSHVIVEDPNRLSRLLDEIPYVTPDIKPVIFFGKAKLFPAR